MLDADRSYAYILCPTTNNKNKNIKMRTPALCSKAFMNVSESRIERIRWSGSDDERWYVDRLFDSPATYRRWESSHYGLMNKVAASQTTKGQVVGLRKAWFSLLQRQALFQHLRESNIIGAEREMLVSAFHASTDYSEAVVAEHGNFLRSNSSLLCATYLGRTLLDDKKFNEGLNEFHSAYMEFFSLHCNWIIAEKRGHDFPLRPVLTEMKTTLSRVRNRLMALPLAESQRWSAWH